MFSFTHRLRICYRHTDQMGYVYYGRYSEFFEETRAESMRSIGLTYKQLEAQGLFAPIMNLRVNYYKPLFYDELITIEATVKDMPELRVRYFFKIFNEAGELAADGETSMVFVDTERKTIPVPAMVEKAFAPFFKG